MLSILQNTISLSNYLTTTENVRKSTLKRKREHHRCTWGGEGRRLRSMVIWWLPKENGRLYKLCWSKSQILRAQVWLSKRPQCAWLGAGYFRCMLSFYSHINPAYLHVSDKKPTGPLKVMDLIRGIGLNELRPCNTFKSRLFYKFTFQS